MAKKPFDNAGAMRNLFLAGSLLVGTIVAGTVGVRSFFRGEPVPTKAPEAVVAVEGGVELGSMDKNTKTLTVPVGTHIQVMAPGHLMLSNGAGKTSKDMFFDGQLNVKITGAAGNVNVTAYADVANSRGSTVLNFTQTAKGHNIVCDATRVPSGKLATILEKGEGKFTFIAPQPMDENGFKTSRNPKGLFITNADDLGFLLVGAGYKGDVSLQTPKGRIQVSGQPHNILQDSLKALATPPAVGGPAAPVVEVPVPPGGMVDPPPAKLDMPPVEKKDMPEVKRPPTAEEKLAQSRLEVREKQQKVLDAAVKLRGDVLDARQITRDIIANNPRIDEYTRECALANYDFVTRNVQGNFDVWIGRMQLSMRQDDIAAANRDLGESLGILGKAQADFRGNKADAEKERREKARQDAKEKTSPLSSTGSGNSYAVTVRSFGENSTISVSPTAVSIVREDGKDGAIEIDAKKRPTAQITQLKITEPGTYDIHFKGTARDGVAFQVTSTHKDATVRVHFDNLETHLSGAKALPIEVRAAGPVTIKTDDPKPEKLELKPVGKNTSVELDAKPLIKVVEPKTPVKIQEGDKMTISSLTPVDGFKSLAAAQERPASHAGRLERNDFGIG